MLDTKNTKQGEQPEATPFVTLDEFFKLMGLGRNTGYEMLGSPDAPRHVRWGRRVSILRSELQDWPWRLAERRNQ